MSRWDIDNPVEELSAVRALRARPPGEATADRERHAVLGAALQQFEELLMAAHSLGSASAPIPLFYALNQAGRAIAAARLSGAGWQTSGHGLHPRINRGAIGETVLLSDERGLFVAVSDATGSPRLADGVTLSDLWASLPGMDRATGLGAEAPAVYLLETELPPDMASRARIREGDGSLLLDAESFFADQAAYPDAMPAKVPFHVGNEIHLEWPSAIRDVVRPYLDAYYLRPGIGPDRQIVLSPLMTWWAVLLALSSLARYEPSTWTAVLAPDRSELAVPIERALRMAVLCLPRLVLDALTA